MPTATKTNVSQIRHHALLINELERKEEVSKCQLIALTSWWELPIRRNTVHPIANWCDDLIHNRAKQVISYHILLRPIVFSLLCFSLVLDYQISPSVYCCYCCCFEKISDVMLPVPLPFPVPVLLLVLTSIGILYCLGMVFMEVAS